MNSSRPVLEKPSQNLCAKLAVATVSGLVTVVAFLTIRELDRNKLLKKSTAANLELNATRENVLQVQKKISLDREVKLRGLNTTPVETVQTETVQKEIKIPITPTPAKKKADTKTKTS